MDLLWLIVVVIVLCALFGGIFLSKWLFILIIIAILVAAFIGRNHTRL